MAGKESMDHGWWRMDFPRSETAGCVEIKLGQERWKMDGEIAVPLKGSGRRQERALTASAIHSTKVATRKEMIRLLGRVERRRFQFRGLSLSPLFCLVLCGGKLERRGAGRCRAATGGHGLCPMGPWPTAHWNRDKTILCVLLKKIVISVCI